MSAVLLNVAKHPSVLLDASIHLKANRYQCFGVLIAVQPLAAKLGAANMGPRDAPARSEDSCNPGNLNLQFGTAEFAENTRF